MSGKISIPDSDVIKINTEYTYGTWRKQSGWNPLLYRKAYDCFFEDANGQKYLDFSSQLMCSNLGHGNKRIKEAIIDQLDQFEYAQPSYATEIRAKVAQQLKSVLPANLDRYFFGSSGTEANEAVIKTIRMFFSKEKKYKIISNYNSYHGSTMGSVSLTGDYRRRVVDPFYAAQGIIHAPPPYCYRCPLGLKFPECGIACADYLKYIIKNEGNVGGILIEPVTGTNGVVVPPGGYMERIREITKEEDVVLATDEVMSGWGRTGEWFAVDNWKVKPDILTTAKGITGAYLPLSLMATDKKISDYFQENLFAHGHTYEAHPVALAAANAAITEYKERDLVRNSKYLGEDLHKRLEEIKERHKSVGDVRSIGLFGAVELVKNREKKTPFNDFQEKIEGKPLTVDKVAREAMKNGVYISTWISHFIIAPPLIISREELNNGLDVLDRSLTAADAEVE